MVPDESMQRVVDERAKITISGHWGVAGRPVLGSSAWHGVWQFRSFKPSEVSSS